MTTAPAVRFARPYDGRHRAEDISNDITVANVLRYRWHRTLAECVPHTGHLGTRARHAMPDDIQQQLDTLRRVYWCRIHHGLAFQCPETCPNAAF